MHPAGVPPIPPARRSTGFWIGVSAAITIGIVGAVLIGFFIGRGSRLSNESVQSKIVQQSQADQIAEQQALDSQKAAFTASEARAVSAAKRTAYTEGQQAGFTAGQQQGYTSGQSQGFIQGQAAGTAQGETAGFSQGLNQGACFANSVFCNGG
jgi:flagellar biosynthesis/type III secretory pathway protein FliH